MKAFLLLVILFTSLTAQASYFATHCSTADGSVRWETGHNSNTIKFEINNETKIFNFYNIETKSEETYLISKVVTNNCRMSMSTTIYVETVTITSPTNAEIAEFLNQYFDGAAKVQVLCKHQIDGRSACPEDMPQNM